MKIKQRTEVSMVTHEITVVRVQSGQLFCELCDSVTPHLSLNEAVSVLERSAETVRQMAETGMVHHSTTADGLLRICGNSVADIENEDSR